MSTRARATDALTGSRAPASWRRHVPGIVVLIVGIALSAAAFGLVRSRARQAQQAAFEKRASRAARALQTSLDLSLEVLRTLPSLFEASQEVTRQEFRAFVRDGLSRHSSIFAFIWAKRVFAAERSAFERAARAEGYPDFQITESDEQRRMVRAPDRAEYLPCLYIEPPIPLSFGYDEASEIRRATTAERARDSGLAVVSPRLPLIIDNPNVTSVIVFVPVYETGSIPPTVGERRRTLRGFGVELFRIAPLIARLQQTDDFAGLAMGLVDATDGNDEAVLYETEAGVAHAGAPAPHVLLSRSTFPFAGRTWALVSSSPMPSPPGSGIVLVLGVLLSVLLAGIVTALNTIIRLRRRIGAALKLGQYTLEEKLGEGGMGVVYRATHAMLRRPTAIKLLLPDRAGKEALTRFEREVRRTAMLTHPNTVTVFDYGRTTDGLFYYAMELLEGASLDEVVKVDGPQPEERVIHLLEQAAASLAEAHDAGLIHRDVKPGNILVVDRGGISDLVKVVDFGLVKDVGTLDGGGATSETALTMANAITGTPLYIAPETLTAPDTIDARADIYALGAVGYWLLTGTHVFGGTSIFEVCAHHLHSVPDPPSIRLGAPVSADLESVLLACLAKRPEERPASAHILRERLLACAAAARWTNARAAEWWVVHRHQLRSGGAGASAASTAVNARVPHFTVTRIAS